MSDYEILRISLNDRDRGPTALADDALPVPTKSEYLREVFGSRRAFEYGIFKYTYVPIMNEPDKFDGFIFGVLGRDEKHIVEGTSSIDFKEVIHLWGKSEMIAVNVNELTKGETSKPIYQTIFCEQGKLGVNNSKLIRALLSRAKEEIPRSDKTRSWSNLWNDTVLPLTRRQYFWEFLNRNLSRVKTLEFYLAEPNGPDLNDLLKDFVKDLSVTSNANTVLLAIEADEGGINPASPELKELVEYASEGTGHVVARGKKRKNLFDSSSQESKLLFRSEAFADRADINHMNARDFSDNGQRFLDEEENSDVERQ